MKARQINFYGPVATFYSDLAELERFPLPYLFDFPYFYLKLIFKRNYIILSTTKKTAHLMGFLVLSKFITDWGIGLFPIQPLINIITMTDKIKYYFLCIMINPKENSPITNTR